MSTTAADCIAGVVIPDTELVREITAFIRDTEDQISSVRYCVRSTTPTNPARTALSETSTLTYSSISTHRSSAMISSISSATTPGPSEMHSNSGHLKLPNQKRRADLQSASTAQRIECPNLWTTCRFPGCGDASPP